MQRKSSYPPIGALLRGLDLLKEVNALPTATVGKLHERTGISKSTIVRNLETLEHAGFIARDSSGEGYVTTAKVLALSSGYNRDRRLIDIATPLLNEFRMAMPWPSDLALFDGESMVILETSRNPGTLALSRPVGARLPVTESALGRAYLAFVTEDKRQVILNSHFGKSRKKRAELEHELSRFREQGFSENNQSLSVNTRGVGVPVLVDDQVVACINTIVLSEAMSMNDVVKRCVRPLQAVAKSIGKQLKQEGSA